MPSLNQTLSDVQSAQEAVDNPAVRHALSTSASQRLRAFLESNPYAFTYAICGHVDMVPEVHMPISFAACGKADLLAWSITQSGFEGYVIDELREACRIRGIDPRTPEGVAKLDAALDWVNFRIFRAWFKSSVITHGGVTYTATVDPNSTNKITTAVDKKAFELCKQIGRTVQSGRYADIFPDRVPLDPQGDVTESTVTLAGRTISHPQTTIQSASYRTKDVGGHYDHFWLDDLVVGGRGGNNTPAELPGVHDHLTGMTGFWMPTRRVRTIHAGTRWDENDDHAFLTTKNRALACFSIVVPIEVHDDTQQAEGAVVNIMERGKPTCPTFLNEQRIQALQDRVLADETEVEGSANWRCNYLLDPGIGGGRMFSSRVVGDPDRRWRLVPHKDPEILKKHPDRYRVARVARDAQGRPLSRETDKPLVETYHDNGVEKSRLVADWKRRAKWLVFDPWRDLYIVMTLDPSWKNGGNNWAITIAGIDYEGVMYQLDCVSENTGEEGWPEALIEMDRIWSPKVIGFGGGGIQDSIVKNKFTTDPQLRKLRGRLVGLPENEAAKPARIRAGVAEPLKQYKWMLAPGAVGDPARDEAKAYKGGRRDKDDVLDSMCMVPAVLRRARSPEDRKAARERASAAERLYRQSIDPYTGVPNAA